MSSRRTARLSEAIRQTVSTVILMELRDPRIQDVTVTRVEAAADMRTAKIYVSVMGDEKKQSLAIHGLNSARGFLQSKVADRIQTRYTPILRFELDQGIKRSLEASRILRDVIHSEGDGEAGIDSEADIGADIDNQTETALDHGGAETCEDQSDPDGTETIAADEPRPQEGGSDS